jgi:CheY-specific phosphatase CheX
LKDYFEMQITISEETIEKANALFWEQMLAMELKRLPWNVDTATALRCIGNQHMAGRCGLSGQWNGWIEVRLSHGLARNATAAMLILPSETIESEDMLDAIREITNMIAGTIKSALPRPCTMTVPTAQLESGDFCVVSKTPGATSVFFHHESGELMIRVCEETCSV